MNTVSLILLYVVCFRTPLKMYGLVCGEVELIFLAMNLPILMFIVILLSSIRVNILASDNIWSVVDGGDGKLYMGHVHHGFSVLSLKDKKVKNFMYDPEDPVSLPGNGVTCIYKDLSGNI